eukprot:CAMPEP_0194208036 /NCGR_PEP_ID=MMETSP0156-20130528/6606_1 /TAXON_ID=33649 /ORGANISM="Thalassionema nitzschioides, Strain L26-B" /LENGTH=402 /DNA_ID=CAMNT_0038934921 /DNA_START=77 /DNA_END=1285 /DNA_ORIENTATION=-
MPFTVRPYILTNYEGSKNYHRYRKSQSSYEKPDEKRRQRDGREQDDNASVTVLEMDSVEGSAPLFNPDPQINEDEKVVQFFLDMPGVKTPNIKVVVVKRKMTISGMRFVGKKWISFFREFDLDVISIDVNTIKANLLNGVLTIKADKKEKGNPISIKVTTFKPGEEEALKKEAEEKEQRKKKAAVFKKKIVAKKKRQQKQQKVDSAMPSMGEELSLLIDVVSCRDLLIADKFGKSDPYVMIFLGDKKLHQTKYIKQTLDPVYTEEHDSSFVLNVTARKLFGNEGLLFKLIDFDLLSSDDPIGEVQVSAEDLIVMDGEETEYEVTPPADRANEYAGQMTIRVQYANDEDREHYGAKSKFTFWEPPSKEVVDMYKIQSRKVNPSLKGNAERRRSHLPGKGGDFC